MEKSQSASYAWIFPTFSFPATLCISAVRTVESVGKTSAFAKIFGFSKERRSFYSAVNRAVRRSFQERFPARVFLCVFQQVWKNRLLTAFPLCKSGEICDFVENSAGFQHPFPTFPHTIPQGVENSWIRCGKYLKDFRLIPGGGRGAAPGFIF